MDAAIRGPADERGLALRSRIGSGYALTALACWLAVFLSNPATLTAEPPSTIAAPLLCTFTDSRGVFRQVNGLESVPKELQSKARCIENTNRFLASEDESGSESRKPFVPLAAVRPAQSPRANGSLAAPDKVTLDGSERRVSMNSSLGPIDLRWPRSVEALFGRTPERAMADAALTASRALKRKSFPPHIRNLRLEWKVVFFEGALPEGEIPDYLRSTCHPGWMTPPANIYVVAARVVGNCGRPAAERGNTKSERVADAELAQLLIHEIGHAVEYHLINSPLPREGLRAEGFATWFESFASDYSSVIPRGRVSEAHRSIARAAMQQRPGAWQFGYSGEDYSRAAMYFLGLESRVGLPALLRVYEQIVEKRLPFLSAASAELGITPAEIERVALKAAGVGN